MANVISVSALNRYVKSLLESDAVLTDVAIRGEIQNFVHHYKSGHFYFSLKDDTGSVKAVMFKSYAARLSFVPENGMSVVVRGRISLYERDGAFQIYVDSLFPDGIGAAQVAFEQLKNRLAGEGLFAPEAKKRLPAFPRCIGLVTSKTGAAIKDIYSVAQRRWPLAQFLLYDASVQGKEAENALVDGVKTLDASGRVDVIIVGRGGGSREDLWVFNSEALARAVWGCKTPVVSGVGHEIDFTILDFVADLRAATPTAAAELVLPDAAAVRERMRQIENQCKTGITNKYKICYTDYAALCRQAARYAPDKKLAEYQLKNKAAAQAMAQAMRQKLAAVRQLTANRAALAHSLSPMATLGRGYCLAYDAKGAVLRQIEQVQKGDRIRLELSCFYADCVVEELTERETKLT